MKQEAISYIALGGEMHDQYAIAEAYRDYASTSDSKKEQGYYNRKALKAKAKGIVAHDRDLDRLVKEYK